MSALARNGPSKFCGEGLMLRAERTWRGRYLRATRVTPLTFYPEWMVQVAYQGAGAPQVRGGLAAPLPGTTYAGTRWSTLAYVEKVRRQFLSLRHTGRKVLIVQRFLKVTLWRPIFCPILCGGGRGVIAVVV